MRTTLLATSAISALALGSTALVASGAQAQAPAAQPKAAANAEPVRPVAVSQIKGKDVYSLKGEDLGEIERIILGQGDQVHAVIKFGEFLGLGGEARILPLSRLSMRDDRIVVSNMSEAELKALPAWRTGLAGYRDAEAAYQVRFPVFVAVAAPAAPATEGSRIVVQQTAPVVKVDPADPRVTVRQAPPTVTVRQAQPEILVRQPAPTVTVDIPQPEIIVRMPQPDVNVAMAQPQVSVNQPPPHVQVVQPQQQPQVQVQPTQPQVMVQRAANAEANVQVQGQGQPTVRYERAEPRIVVNQAKGEPQIRMEPMGAPATATANANQVRPVAVSRIKGKGVYNQQGQDLGEIERVVLGQGDQAFAVVKFGETLGLGGESRLVPLSRMALREDRVLIPGMSEAELKGLPVWRSGLAGYREAEPNYRANLSSLAAADRAQDRAGVAVNERAALRQRIGPLEVDATAATTPPKVRPFAISALVERDVYNLRGEELGEIETVIVNPDNNQRYLVVEHGGFLGIGEQQVAIPMTRVQLRGDRLVVPGLTDEELDALPEWRRRMPKAREVARTETAEIVLRD